ncbi:MAG: EAL domain-containing protein [Thiohalomonadaceae bacterium]
MFTLMGLQHSQWVALGLVLLRTPVAGWFDGKKLITSILIMAGLVLFATGAFPEFVSALLVLTPMSSFGYLKNLPVDFIKIDGAFVRDICSDSTARVMVGSIHNIGKEMGLKTVAEYVESREILDELRQLGINYAQGFYLGKPSPLATTLTGVRMMPR